MPPRPAPADGSAATLPCWKRWTDCLVAGILLVLTAPVVLVALALVKLTSAGPAVYSQTRLGLNRRRFTIYKIRTMTHNCEARTGIRWATKNDTRVTFIGRILRATHIDELLQLWNVLRGDMSLVGPRPERPEIIQQIEPLVPGYGARLTLVPGVTGLAQVQLPPDTDIDSVRRKILYDIHYANVASLWLDLRLMAATLFKVVGMPFGVSRLLLWLPGAPEVEAASDTGPGLAVGAARPDLSGA